MSNTVAVFGDFWNEIFLFDVDSGKLKAQLPGHTLTTDGVAFSPDGLRMASFGRDKQIRIWDAMNGNLLTTLRGHRSQVSALGFNRYGSRLISAADHECRIWDITSNSFHRMISIWEDDSTLRCSSQFEFGDRSFQTARFRFTTWQLVSRPVCNCIRIPFLPFHSTRSGC